MPDLKYVTYCGLYCGLCANMGRLPQQASALRGTMRRGGWEHFGTHCLPGFKEFWGALETLSQSAETCPGCRGGCGDPNCAIRKCAVEHAAEVCSSCAEYPCSRIEKLADRYPTLLPDGTRQCKVGLDRWIAEQEERRKSGFCYADIRYPA